MSRPSVTKHCDLLFLVFLVPPDFFSRIFKKSGIFSDFLGTPDFFRFFSKNLEFSQIFLVPPDFFLFFFSTKNQVFTYFLSTPRFWERVAAAKKNPTGSRRLSPTSLVDNPQSTSICFKRILRLKV